MQTRTSRNTDRGVRPRFVAGVWLLVLLVGGCQILNLADLGQSPSSAPESAISEPASPKEANSEATASPVSASHDFDGDSLQPSTVGVADQNLVQQLRDLLPYAEWQVSLRWSVLSHTQKCPSQSWKWIVVFPTSNREFTPQLISLAQRWEWLWDGVTENDDHRAIPEVQLALHELQQQTWTGQATAAILLARLDPEHTAVSEPQLREVVKTGHLESGSLPISTRSAAAEIWCRVLSSQSQTDKELALAPAGELLALPALPESLVATLWQSLAQDVAPDRLPRLSETLQAMPAGVTMTVLQTAALEACVIAAAADRLSTPMGTVTTYHEREWPPHLVSWRLSDSPVARQLVGRWAAWANHPLAGSLLMSQRHDAQVSVKHAAIVSLGLWEHEAGRRELRAIASTGTDPERALAVLSLAQKNLAEVEPFVTAERAIIRRSIAEALQSQPTTAAAALLKRLLQDADPEVQAAAIKTASNYPAELAVPLLLAGIEDGTFATRKTAQIALSKLDPNAPVFPLDGSLESRKQAVLNYVVSQKIAKEPWLANYREAAFVSSPRGLDGNEGQRLESLLHAYLQTDSSSPTFPALQTELWKLSKPDDVAMLEAAIRDQHSLAARNVQNELLPRLSASYAAIRELTSSDVLRRRQAAKNLQTISTQHPLSPDAVRQLIEPLAKEQDQQVWQYCLQAIQADRHSAAQELALLALHNPWPDVRRASLEYFRQHPSPEIATAVLPLLRESNPRLQTSAAEVLGLCGNPQVIHGFPATPTTAATGGLRDLLTTSHPDVQWATLTALARLRDDEAYAELLRRLQAPETAVRLQAVRAIGASQQSRFVGPLIQLVWTDSQSTLRQAVLETLDQLVAVDERPAEFSDGLAATRSIDDNVQIWVRWWEDRTQRPVSAAVVKGVEGKEFNE